jgi:hypothetical protein
MRDRTIAEGRRAGFGVNTAAVLLTCALATLAPGTGDAAEIMVAAGGNLQAALNGAQPGDTILLEPGAEFLGPFVLPLKTGNEPITIRSAAPDDQLPRPGVRIGPSYSHLLPKLRSSHTAAAIRTAPGAHGWRLAYLEFAANRDGHGDIIQLGEGTSAQASLDRVPHDIILSHLYVHGDPLLGQKRCIALNAAAVTIRDSYVSDCKGVGMDTQAICGWNGPGPFVIENNYLEGAGENVMFGGADPAIQGLVPDGITFRGNHLAKPMSWRDPIIPTPRDVAAAVGPGGTLPPGTYAYRIVARRPVGQGYTGRSTASAEVSIASPGGAVHLAWAKVPNATEYLIYGRSPGAQAQYWVSKTESFVDTGAAGTSGAVPTSAGTVWTVKNLFELKNARNVVVEYNVMENHWKQAQAGWAIVFTPRNSNGKCTWCVVERVTFQFNVVRNVSGGINVLGFDDPVRGSKQTRDLIISRNLFTRVTTALGGSGWFLQLGDEPRDITVDHNTIDHDGSTLVYAYGGTASAPRRIQGLQFTNNAARHGKYGFSGAYFAYGSAILANYYPGAVFDRNYLAGGSASRYPAGNLFAGSFPDAFVDAAQGDFRAAEGSLLSGAATDGSAIGCEMEQRWPWINAVVAGRPLDDGEGSLPAPHAPGNLRVVG